MSPMRGNEQHLAQFNVARMLAPIDDPVMEGFRSQLDRINALADQSPGFVWRLQTEGGDTTSIRAYADPLVIVNMSVWESLEALHQYVYKSPHVGPLRDRRQWFEPATTPVLVLWWVPAGHIPAVEEELLKAHEDAVAKGRAALRNTTDEHLMTPWRLLVGGQVVMENLRHVVLADTFMHLAHHRGQLTVYLRLLGAPVPAIYGPSADDNSFG